jgi:hypothetical protein
MLSLECTLAAEAGAGAAELHALAALVAGLAAAPPAPSALPDDLHARSHSGARAADAPAGGPADGASCRAPPLDAEAARDGAGGGARRRALVALLGLAPGLESEYAMQDGQVAAAALLQGLTPALTAPWQHTLRRILTQ